MKKDALIPAIAAIALAGTGGRFRSRRFCSLCEQPILAGEGYRTVAGLGTVHGKCAKEREDAGKAK